MTKLTEPTNTTPEVIIKWGLPASGKTTEAKKWVEADPTKRVRINYDDLRLAAGITPGKFNRLAENKIQAQAADQFDNALRLGLSVVVDNTSLSTKVRDAWVSRAFRHGVVAKVEQAGKDLSIWDLIRRDDKRGSARVGRAVIERMALSNNLINWDDYDNGDFVICDLDGTLADITHRRHFVEQFYCSRCNGPSPNTVKNDFKTTCVIHDQPIGKDWKSFNEGVANDVLNGPVADLLDMFYNDGYYILLVSGRSINPCGIPTQEWLEKFDIKYDHLFMRNGGDSRPDTVIKKEILDHLPKDRIDYVIDDRSSVVKMWRDEGLFVLQCAEGNF